MVSSKPKYAKPTPERILLTKFLAETDAAFFPMRGLFDRQFARVRFERQRQFRTAGLPLGGSGSQTARKQHERLLSELETAGLVVFGLDVRGQRAGVRLSPLGDACTRRMTAGTPMSEAWPLFVSMYDLCQRATRRLLPEPLFCGNHDWRGTDEECLQLTRLQYDLLAFFAAGYVDAASDSDGKAWYGVTAAGFEALAAGCPKGPPEEIEFDEPLGGLYDELLRTAEADLRNAKAKIEGHVVIPIANGTGWGGCFSEWFKPGMAPVGSLSFAEEFAQRKREPVA